MKARMKPLREWGFPHDRHAVFVYGAKGMRGSHYKWIKSEVAQAITVQKPGAFREPRVVGFRLVRGAAWEETENEIEYQAMRSMEERCTNRCDDVGFRLISDATGKRCPDR
jgi:hypothetical protein